MTFLISYRIPSGTYLAGTERFKQSGGLPPAGIEFLARWHRVDGSGGVAICKTDDAAAIARWAREWADVISMEVVPVLDDATMAAVIA